MALRALDEVAEHDAPAETKALYADIKACLGVPVINLIFRNMASIPDCLEYVWSAIRPLYVSGEAAAAQEQLVDAILPGNAAKWSVSDLLSLGLTEEEVASVKAVLQTYIRANPANMMGMLCLAMLLQEQPLDASDELLADRGYQPDPLPALLPMTAPNDMSPAAATAYQRLTEQLHGPGGSVSPSLYRHFAQWPGLMTLIADQTDDLVRSDLGKAGDAMLTAAADRASALAAQLPAPDRERPDPDVVSHILDLAHLFPPNMCKMTILAEFLLRGLNR